MKSSDSASSSELFFWWINTDIKTERRTSYEIKSDKKSENCTINLKEISLVVFTFITEIFNMSALFLFFKLFVSKKKGVLLSTSSLFCIDPTKMGQKRTACYIQLDASILLFYPHWFNLLNRRSVFDFIVNFK